MPQNPLDFDNESDLGLFYQSGDREDVQPMRQHPAMFDAIDNAFDHDLSFGYNPD